MTRLSRDTDAAARHARWAPAGGVRPLTAGARARVTGIEERAVRVDLGRGVTGVVAREELPFLAGRSHAALEGTRLRVVEVAGDGGDGVVHLSARLVALERCRRALAAGRTLRGRVVAAGREGLLLDVGGVRGFVPAGALPEGGRPAVGDRWRGRATSVTDHLCVLGADPGAPVAGGPGGVLTGVVEAVGPEGAWLRLTGAGAGARRGLAVRDELGWSPRPHVAVGDVVSGAVLDFTMAGPRISARALQPSPWPAIALELAPGTPVTVAVLATEPGGAHVRLVDQPHAEALLDARDLPGAVQAGAWLRARVAHVDAAGGAIALSAVTTGRDPRPGRGASTA